MALSISFLSPIFRVPVALLTRKMASLIFRPDLRFLAVTFFQSRTRPNFSFGSSSLISLRRQSFSLSRPRFRPPGNIHTRSLLRRTKRTLPRFTATSFDDFAITRNQSRFKYASSYMALLIISRRRRATRAHQISAPTRPRGRYDAYQNRSSYCNGTSDATEAKVRSIAIVRLPSHGKWP
jgi:hypothetical protein